MKTPKTVWEPLHKGLLAGPGTGAYLPEVDRMIFAGHYSTAERDDGRVVMYYRYSLVYTVLKVLLYADYSEPRRLKNTCTLYSDDGGETFKISNSIFPRADESSVTAVRDDGQLVVNLRRDVTECEICTPKAGGCNCRGRSFSEGSQ